MQILEVLVPKPCSSIYWDDRSGAVSETSFNRGLPVAAGFHVKLSGVEGEIKNVMWYDIYMSSIFIACPDGTIKVGR